MSTRREFIKTVLGGVAGVSLAQLGCAGGLATYRGTIQNAAIMIPETELVALQNQAGVLIVTASGLPGPVILRRTPDEGMVALLSICTHRGCEVRPLPHSLQCPCHGSEYDQYGEVLEGPATQPLTRYQVEKIQGNIVIRI